METEEARRSTHSLQHTRLTQTTRAHKLTHSSTRLPSGWGHTSNDDDGGRHTQISESACVFWYVSVGAAAAGGGGGGTLESGKRYTLDSAFMNEWIAVEQMNENQRCSGHVRMERATPCSRLLFPIAHHPPLVCPQRDLNLVGLIQPHPGPSRDLPFLHGSIDGSM